MVALVGEQAHPEVSSTSIHSPSLRHLNNTAAIPPVCSAQHSGVQFTKHFPCSALVYPAISLHWKQYKLGVPTESPLLSVAPILDALAIAEEKALCGEGGVHILCTCACMHVYPWPSASESKRDTVGA